MPAWCLWLNYIIYSYFLYSSTKECIITWLYRSGDDGDGGDGDEGVL